MNVVKVFGDENKRPYVRIIHENNKYQIHRADRKDGGWRSFPDDSLRSLSLAMIAGEIIYYCMHNDYIDDNPRLSKSFNALKIVDMDTVRMINSCIMCYRC